MLELLVDKGLDFRRSRLYAEIAINAFEERYQDTCLIPPN